MPRIEYKYLIDEQVVPQFIKELKPYLEMDKYSKKVPGHRYTVRSLYYDTPNLDYYQEKLSGIKIRKKVRIRGYNSETSKSLVFLEIKKKNGPTISKIRAKVRFRDVSRLLVEKDLEKYIINGDNKCHHVDDAGQFFYYMESQNLGPMIKVIYEREAYYYKFNHDLRITFDYNLRSSLNIDLDSLYADDNVTYSTPGKSILEVKLGGEIPAWLSNLLSIYKLHLQAFSKYTTCLDSHSRYERQLRQSLHGMSRYNAFNHYSKAERIKISC